MASRNLGHCAHLTPAAAVAYLDGLKILNLQLKLLGHQGGEDHLVHLEDSAQSLQVWG